MWIMAYQERITVEQAISILIEYAAIKGTMALPLLEAAGYICAEDLKTTIPQPPFDRSAMDGYAVRRTDLENASKDMPILLPISDCLYAGSASDTALAPGHAVRIMTGAPIPEGADCVIPQEIVDCDKNAVIFYKPQTGKLNICIQGEDITKGTFLIRQGTRLQAAHIGLLAGQGISHIMVFEKPEIAVMSTGDELVPIGSPLSSGKIYDSNQPMLCARLMELGAQPYPILPVADRTDLLCDRISEALVHCDMIITTGGVSVGQRDLLPEAVKQLGGHILFHGIAAKPGSPAMAAVYKEKMILCLSGNPFAAAATFELLGRPAIYFMGGLISPFPTQCNAILCSSFLKDSKIRRFVRAYLSDGKVTIPDVCHSSGSLSSFAGCNCLVDIPAGHPPLQPGEIVRVILL